MVVATRAGDGEAEKGFGDDVDLVVGETHFFLERVDGGEAVEDHAEVADAEGGLVEAEGGVEAGFFEEVAGEVFADELVVGDVGVEGADEIVAVAPRVGHGCIALAAVGIGVARPIHPMTRPAFAETGRREERINRLGEGGGVWVGGEGGEFGGGGGQAAQGETQAAQEGGGVGARGAGELGGGEGAGEEAVDGVRAGVGCGEAGERGGLEGAETPPVFAAL